MSEKFELAKLPFELWEPALEAGRRALADMDENDVPARLRKVAKHTGGRLPPPLARTLLVALDADEWLRKEALEVWQEVDPEAEGAAGASALFLLRPPDWEIRVEAAAEQVDRRRSDSSLADLRRTLAAAETRQQAAEARAVKAEKELASLRAAEGNQAERLKAQIADSRRSRRGPEEQLRRRVVELETERDRISGENRELSFRLERLQSSRHQKEKRRTTSAPRTVTTSWRAADAATRARQLDELMQAALHPPLVSEPEVRVVEGRDSLPVGVPPDSAAAIQWLLSQPKPFTLVVDGYNVTYLISPTEMALAKTRDFLQGELERLRRVSTAPVSVVVVYDGPDTESGKPRRRGGVEVRFSQGETADVAIRRLAAELSGLVVVVSTDREVREGIRHAHGIGLWSQSLVSWIRRV